MCVRLRAGFFQHRGALRRNHLCVGVPRERIFESRGTVLEEGEKVCLLSTPCSILLPLSRHIQAVKHIARGHFRFSPSISGTVVSFSLRSLSWRTSRGSLNCGVFTFGDVYKCSRAYLRGAFQVGLHEVQIISL